MANFVILVIFDAIVMHLNDKLVKTFAATFEKNGGILLFGVAFFFIKHTCSLCFRAIFQKLVKNLKR